MLPTFVIGLREGLEAALIVGIIAAFLRKQGRRDLLRSVMIGVGIALAICIAIGVGLHVYSQDLPQKQQEGLETVIGALAVGMVTYMVVWMRRNSRNLKGQLESLAADAIGGAGGAGRAMVLMAFLAVIREGIETVVFVLAAFNEAANGTTAGAGLLLGLALAIALGYGIYRGGVHLNLSKFFRGTGIVLVFVAAGIVVNTLHTAHEAGWLDWGQNRTVDLTWLVDPGSVQSSLLTGMLGLQPYPVTIEVVGWLVYLIPVGLYVAWPPGRTVPKRPAAITSAVVAVVAGVAALLCVTLAPSAPTERPTLSASTSAGAVRVVVSGRTATAATVRATAVQPVAKAVGAPATYRLTSGGQVEHAGAVAEVFTASVPGSGTAGRKRSLTIAEVAALNGGQLPIGLGSSQGNPSAAYRDAATLTVWLDTRTDRVVDVRWSEKVTATLTSGSRVIPLDDPVATGTVALPASARAVAVSAASSAHGTLDHRSALRHAAAWLLVLAILALLAAAVFVVRLRRTPAPADATPPVPSTLVKAAR